MFRRQRFVPVVIVAIFVVAACAVALAHAKPDELRTCIAAKVRSESTPTWPADLAAPLVTCTDLAAPASAASPDVREATPGLARQVFTGPDAPRAPPA